MPLRLDLITGLGDVGPSWTRWMGGLNVFLRKWTHYSQSLAPEEVSANTTEEQTFAVTGLTTKDVVYVNKPSHQTGLGIVNARVSAANTLALTFMNNTGSGITPTTETYDIVAIRKD